MIHPQSYIRELGLAGVEPPAPADIDVGAEPVSTENEDGSIDILLNPEREKSALQHAPHDANLAELLTEQELGSIATELLQGIEADVESNAENYRVYAEGMKLMGFNPRERLSKPFEGASGATHSLLKECCVRFAANATSELLPPDGPVRCKIFGDESDPNLERRAQRKQGYLNFFLTEEDDEYYDDFDQMTFMLGMLGSVFRKVWRDPLRDGEPADRFFTPYDIVVNNNATTMHGPYRVTHIEPMAPSNVLRLQLKKWFSDLDLAPSDDDSTKRREAQEEAGVRRPTDRDEDYDRILMHCHCLLDLESLPHTDEDGEPTGLALPYVVTIDKTSEKILRIARNWSAEDPNMLPRKWYAHYRYMMGPGFHGVGLTHLVGNDTDTLSTLRRQAINAFTLNSFPGGVRVKTARGENSTLTPGPGEFIEIETGGQPISAALMPLPYRDVPPSYSVLTEEVLTAGQRIGSVGDMAVGDAREDALPGTVLALIARATKIEGNVIERMIRAQRQELRMLADLIGLSGKKTYPYAVNGQTGMALAEDFHDNADVAPVADPKMPLQTQRLADAQAKWTICQQSGGVMSAKPVLEGVLRVMGCTDQEIQAYIPGPQQAVTADPITEFSAVMHGAPLKAGIAQDHLAHFHAHATQLATPGIADAPQGNALKAHISEHTAMYYALTAARLAGIQSPPGGPLPPQMENQVAAAVAASSDALRVAMLAMNPTPAGADPVAMAKIQLDRDKLQADQQKQQMAMQDAARNDMADRQRIAMEQQNDEAQRQTDLRMAMVDHENEMIKARAAVATATIGANADRASNATAEIVAKEKTEQATQGAKSRAARTAKATQ